MENETIRFAKVQFNVVFFLIRMENKSIINFIRLVYRIMRQRFVTVFIVAAVVFLRRYRLSNRYNRV